MRSFALFLSLFLLESSARADDFELVPLAPLTPAPAPKKNAKPAPKSDDLDFAVPLAPASPPAKPKKPAPSPEDPVDLIPLVPLVPSAPAAPPRAPPAAEKKKPLPARLALSGPQAPLGVSEQATLVVVVHDENDQPVEADLKVSADLGLVGKPVPAATKGTYTVLYTAPKVAPFSESGTVKVSVTPSPGQKKPVAAELTITFAAALLLPPPPLPAVSVGTEKRRPQSLGPARVVFDDVPPVVEGQTATVRFHVEDSNGQRLSAAGIRIRTSSGTASEARELDGGYVADVSPGEKARGELRVWAVSDGKSIPGEGTIVVTRAARTRAKDDSGGRVGLGVGAFVGGLTNFGYLATPQLELAVDYAVGSALRVGAVGGFSPAGIATAGSKASTVSMTIVPLLVRATYQLELGTIGAYGGGMAGVALLSGQVTSGGLTKGFSQTALEVAGVGGVALGLGPGTALAELRVSRLQVDYKDGTTKVSGGLGGLSLALGYRLEL